MSQQILLHGGHISFVLTGRVALKENRKGRQSQFTISPRPLVATVGEGRRNKDKHSGNFCSKMGAISRQLESAAAQYENLVFNTNSLFNKPAPDPIVALAIGGVSALIV